MNSLFIQILNMSFMASITACVVILIRLFLKKAPKIFSYALWAVVLFRLLCPFTFESIYSLMPANPNTIPQTIINTNVPSIQSNIQPIDDAVNSYLATNSQNDKDANDIPAMFGVIELCSFVWLVGLASFFGYALFSFLRLKRKLKISTFVRDNIYETDRITTPFVLGFIKPKIYLPIGMENIDYILKHEQTHIRRGDHLIKLVAFLALCLHWFNPVIWLSYVLMCNDMEMSCDESVLRHSGSDIRADYSGSLLSLSVKQSGLFSPLAFGESNTKTRIKNVLGYKKPALWISIIAVIAVLCVIVGFAANRVESFNYEKVYWEATHFSTDETNMASIASEAAEHYFNAFSGESIPDEYRYTDFIIFSQEFLAGDEREFVMSMQLGFLNQYSPGEGVPQDDEFLDQPVLIFRIKSLGGNNYEIVNIGADVETEGLTPFTPLTSDETAELAERLKQSIRLGEEGLSFVIPYTDGFLGVDNVWITGRSEYDDGFSKSEHFLIEESDNHRWIEGETYTVPVTPEQAVHFTELSMEIYIPSEYGMEAYTVDLLPYYINDLNKPNGIADGNISASPPKVISSFYEYEEQELPLVAAVYNEGAYLYAIDYTQVILEFQGVSKIFDWSFTTPRFILPLMTVFDYDKDGEKEVAVSLNNGSGTGIDIDDFHIVKMRGDDLIDYHLTREDYENKLENLISHSIYYENERIYINLKYENNSVDIDLTAMYPEVSDANEYSFILDTGMVKFMPSEDGTIKMNVALKLNAQKPLAPYLFANISADMLFSDGKFEFSKIEIFSPPSVFSVLQ